MHLVNARHTLRDSIAVTIAATVSAAALAGIGPVGHWSFNEGRGTVLHDSVGANHGTALGTPTFVRGVDGTALSFDRATNDRVDVGNVPLFDFAGTSDFSVSMWVRYPVGTTGDHYPVSNHFRTVVNGWICFTGVSGGCYGQAARQNFYVSDNCGGPVSATIPMYDGQWHHIVSVCDGGVSKGLYVDGGPIDVSGGAGAIAVQSLSRLVFGGITETNGQAIAGFDGFLDDVQIYDRVLSCAEVNDLFLHPGAEVSLLPDFDFDGDVDGADLATLLGAWGPCGANCSFDLDCSGSVNAADLAVLLGAWTG